MPETAVLIYREADGTAPLLEWLGEQEREPREKCVAALALLGEWGHELRRPHVENLGGGLYELRVKVGRANFRMLYFFHGRSAVVVTHGFTKERKIPPEEITRAEERRRRFEAVPEHHCYSL